MKNHTIRHLSLFITLNTLLAVAPAAHADYEDLLEDCGGHTNYGLAADDSEVFPLADGAMPTASSADTDITPDNANAEPVHATTADNKSSE